MLESVKILDGAIANNKQLTPYAIVLDRPFTIPYSQRVSDSKILTLEIEQWGDDHGINIVPDSSASGHVINDFYKICYRFASMEEAILFKLTFGGEGL